MELRVFADTHPGLERSINEDSFGIYPELSFFIVADGLGGHAGGEVASRIAVEVLRDSIKSNYNIHREVRNNIVNAIKLANTRIINEARKDVNLSGMGTTIVAVKVDNRRALVAHVGDSRAYLIHGGRLTQITKDHSVAEEYIRAGLLTKEEAVFNPYRHALSRALGTSGDVEVDISDISVYPDDTLILCTDGLTNMLPDRDILYTVNELSPSPDKITERLISLANKKGGIDNITVITVCFVE